MRRIATGTVYDPRGVSMAVRRAVLPLQNVPDGNDVISIDPDYRGVHCRALSSHLPLAARAGHFRSVAGRARRRRRVGGGVRHRRSVPHTRAHLLLPATSSDRAPTRRLSHLYDTQRVDAKHEIRLSGIALPVVAVVPTFDRLQTASYHAAGNEMKFICQTKSLKI